MDIRTPQEAVDDFTTYLQLSEKPIEFDDVQRKNIFGKYTKMLETHKYLLTTDDVSNFVDWHKWEYSKWVRFVYVFLDQEGNEYIPLYVGQTQHLRSRITQHREKDWFKYASEIAIEIYNDGEAAELREAELIDQINPLFNKTSNGIGMSFIKDKEAVGVMVPQRNDITTLKFQNTKQSINKYKALGADTKHYLHPALRA
jgi:hypothetical protein